MPVKLFLLFLIFSSFLLSASEKQELDSVLAAVNGDPVTLSEILPALRDREFQLGSSYSGKELEQKILALRRQAVDKAIDTRLIVADFAAQNLVLPQHEIENEVDRWGKFIGCPSRKELEERVKKSGSDMKKIKRKIRERMIVQIMRHREFLLAARPAPADLLRRFKKDEKKYSFPGQIEIALLKLNKNDKDKINSVASELKKDPASWQKMVPLYAINNSNNGSVGIVDLDKLRPEFAGAMKKIEVNTIYPSVQTADGVYFIKVLKFVPPKKAVFKEHVESVKKIMEDEIYRKSSADYALRLRDQAVIEYFFPAPEGVDKK
ncbi:MAG: SurA N-terminal domain-containing protein [Lentisphaeria bacterium]|nr:SurA N-terminal domain-containing protein [Lentisphaeria bacterium]